MDQFKSARRAALDRASPAVRGPLAIHAFALVAVGALVVTAIRRGWLTEVMLTDLPRLLLPGWPWW